MPEASFLFSLVLLLFFGRAFALILKKFDQEPLIGEVVAGFILGILGFVLISVPLDTISQFGILMIMLLAGLTTDFHSFKEQRKTSILVGTFGVIATFGLVFLPLYFLFSLSLVASLFIAAILSNTAIEISAALLLRTDISRRFRSVVMGASFVDDIIAVFLIGIVTTVGFANMAADVKNLEYETEMAGEMDGWMVSNHYTDSPECFPFEITTSGSNGGGPLVYSLYPESDNATFYLYMMIPLSKQGLKGEQTLNDLELEIKMSGSYLLAVSYYYGTTLPTNISSFSSMDSTGALEYSISSSPDLPLNQTDVLYVAIGSGLAPGNHTISFRSIRLEIELGSTEDEGAYLTSEFLFEFIKLTALISLFLIGCLFVVTRVLDRLFDRIIGQGRFFLITFTLVFAFAIAILSKFVGLHEVIGVYIAGLIIGQAGSRVTPMLNRQIAFRKLIDDINPPIRAIFGPLFFGYIGVIMASAIRGGSGDFSIGLWLGFLAVLAVLAFAGKILGCGATAFYSKFGRKESVLVGVAMCGRGALEFVLLSFGLEFGIINEMQFSALVVVTLLSVVLTPVLFTLVNKKMKSDE